MNNTDSIKMISLDEDKEDYNPFINNILNINDSNENSDEEFASFIKGKYNKFNPINFQYFEKNTKVSTNEEKIFNLNNLKEDNFPDFNYKISQNFSNENKKIIKEDKKQKKKSGRKIKENTEKKRNEHTKYSDDNMITKCKNIILEELLEFLNKKIRDIYKNKIGYGIFKKKLLKICNSQKVDATVDFNKKFLDKNLGEIFSDSISESYTNYNLDHNKNLIERLLNEKDENKKIFFKNLFNKTFRDCLQHFREEKHFNELEGLKCFSDTKNEIMKKNNNDEEYIDYLEKYFQNYEEILNRKKARKIAILPEDINNK